MLLFQFVLILVAGVVTSCVAITAKSAPTVDANGWAQFKTKYAKFYATAEEESHRFSVWQRNKKFVEEHVTPSFSVEINHLADLESTELLKQPLVAADTDLKLNSSSFEYVPTSAAGTLPANFDWREKKAIGPVENQGAQGSAAASVVLDVLEAQYVITLKKSFTMLSMSEIRRCCLDQSAPWSTWPEEILKCLQDARGIELATCPKNHQKPRLARHLSSSAFASSNCTVNPQCIAEQIKAWAKVPNQNETLMAESLVQDGPLIALIDASLASFQFYKKGVYDDSGCSKDTVDHAVLVVGYGVQESDGTPYWIVKNSWGSDWGNGGYIWIKRGANTCAIATQSTNVFVQ